MRSSLRLMHFLCSRGKVYESDTQRRTLILCSRSTSFAKAGRSRRSKIVLEDRVHNDNKSTKPFCRTCSLVSGVLSSSKNSRQQNMGVYSTTGPGPTMDGSSIWQSSLTQNNQIGQNCGFLGNCNSTTTTSNSARHLSSTIMESPLRSFPTYTIFGDDAIMQISPILPVFERTSYGMTVKTQGKILLQFVPKSVASMDGSNSHYEGGTSSGPTTTTTRFDHRKAGKIALSPEDIGAILHHVPKGEVLSIDRKSNQNSFSSSSSNASLDKLLTISTENESILFTFDFVSDGIGGQCNNEQNLDVPITVRCTMRNFEVIQVLFRDSLPMLIGWKPLIEYTLKGTLEGDGGERIAQERRGNNNSRSMYYSNNNNSRGSKFRSGGPDGIDSGFFS